MPETRVPPNISRIVVCNDESTANGWLGLGWVYLGMYVEHSTFDNGDPNEPLERREEPRFVVGELRA